MNSAKAVAVLAMGACVLAGCGRPGPLDGTAEASVADTVADARAAKPPDVAAKVPEPVVDVGRPVDLADLVASRPDVFVGLGVEKRGVIIEALNPGVDPVKWRPVVDQYAGGKSHLVTLCTHSRDELTAIADELVERTWSPRAKRIGFAVVVDPVTCSVQLASDELTGAEETALADRYGDALTIVRAPVGRA